MMGLPYMLSMFTLLCVVIIMLLVGVMMIQLGYFHYRQSSNRTAAAIDIAWNSVAAIFLLGLLYMVLQATIS